MADDEEKLVTKPFKFVTGEPPYPVHEGKADIPRSRYDINAS